MEIILKSEHIEWIEQNLKTGKYKTVEEIIETALSLLKQRDEYEQWLAATRAKVDEMLAAIEQESGKKGEIDPLQE
jgi:antitoxin ParD1/3/4